MSADKEKRKIKKINGWVVNHPFCFGNIFYGILALLLTALPLAYIFLPTVAAIYPGEPMAPLFYGSDILIGLFKNGFTTLDANIEYFFYSGGQMMQLACRYLILSAAIILLIQLLFSLFAFVVFLITFIRGYLRHGRLLRALYVWSFVLSLIYASIYLVVLIFIFIEMGMFPNLFIWWNFVISGGILLFMIITSITYSRTYKEVIFEADLEEVSDENKEVVTHVNEVHNVTKVNYVPASTLPPNLNAIGGHAFAENQYLEVANVPNGITSLGGGAFANCLKLKVVSLPVGLKEIGYNCFFNCVSLERINFAGTKEQWRHIRRGSNWLAKAKTTKVVCIDGAIIVNPYH